VCVGFKLAAAVRWLYEIVDTGRASECCLHNVGSVVHKKAGRLADKAASVSISVAAAVGSKSLLPACSLSRLLARKERRREDSIGLNLCECVHVGGADLIKICLPRPSATALLSG
jgi:hypothetical protein